MVARFGLEEPLLTSCAAEDKLFPVVFDCAIYPWAEEAVVRARDICVLDKAKEKKSGAWWRLGAFSLVMGVVVGGLILWRRRNWRVSLRRSMLLSAGKRYWKGWERVSNWKGWVTNKHATKTASPHSCSHRRPSALSSNRGSPSSTPAP